MYMVEQNNYVIMSVSLYKMSQKKKNLWKSIHMKIL